MIFSTSKYNAISLFSYNITLIIFFAVTEPIPDSSVTNILNLGAELTVAQGRTSKHFKNK